MLSLEAFCRWARSAFDEKQQWKSITLDGAQQKWWNDGVDNNDDERKKTFLSNE